MAVDYLQLVRDSRFTKPYDRVSEISTSLKSLAMDTGMVVVGLSQMNRAAEERKGWDKRPKQSDLRESGQLEQDADSILMLFRPHKYQLGPYANGTLVTEKTLEIHALKLRNGKPTEEGEHGQPLVVEYNAPSNRIGPMLADSFELIF